MPHEAITKPNPYLRTPEEELLRAGEERIEQRARLVTLLRTEFIDKSELVYRNPFAQLLDAGNSVEAVAVLAIEQLIREKDALEADNEKLFSQAEEAVEISRAYQRRGVNVHFGRED